MRTPHYSVLVANERTGNYTRIKLGRGVVWVAAVFVVTLPVLIGALAVAAVRAEVVTLRAANELLLAENDGFRVATSQLTGQVGALQTAIDQLSPRAQLDPLTRNAVNKLPAVVRTRAIGRSDAPRPAETLGALGHLLDELADRLSIVRTTVTRQRQLALATPMQWPVVGWLSSAFGNRADPFTGAADFHPGVDISALRGTPVFATADGTVTRAATNGAYGLAVMLDHGFGIATRFGHLSSFAVRAGDTIRRGDVVGYVGSTGRATSSHLHYEILLNGRAINPWPLLTARP